jgi:hypothetical protein
MDDALLNDDAAYVSFKGRQAKGVLYKIDPIPEPLLKRMKAYVEEGSMQKDIRYARAVYGLVNTSGRKDFDLFWEAAWYTTIIIIICPTTLFKNKFFCRAGTKKMFKMRPKNDVWRLSNAQWQCTR